jgi:hypothetical protein
MDCSRILEYVSRRELSRFEGAEARAESAAIAVAQQAEAKEAATKALAKNARVPGTRIGRGRGRGRGRGNRMLHGLALEPEVHTRGRPRGDGRPRGRPRGSWRRRGGGLAREAGNEMADDLISEAMVNVQPLETMHLEDDDLQRIHARTSEEESEHDLLVGSASPNLARSSFIANSALSASPIAAHRRLANPPHLCREVMDSGESEMEEDAMSMSREDLARGRPTFAPDESEGDQHQTKRRRRDSTSTSRQPGPALPSKQPSTARSLSERFFARRPEPSSAESSSSKDIDMFPLRRPPSKHSTNKQSQHRVQRTYQVESEEDKNQESEPAESDTEEYVIDAILEHSYIDDTKYYLVKWQGYEDSSDWVSVEDLAGAPEMVAQYEEKIKRKTGKGRIVVR